MKRGGQKSVRAAAALTGVAGMLLVGCSEAENPFLRVAYCAAVQDDPEASSSIEVELRQAGEVVAAASGERGGVLIAEVPVGVTEVYVNGIRTGSVGLPLDEEGHVNPEEGEVSYYLSGTGCPEQPL